MTKTGNLETMKQIHLHMTGWAIAALLFCLPCSAFAFTATARVDQTRITAQDIVSLQVIVDGGEADVDTSAITGFQVNPAGTQSSRSYINGTWSHKVVYQYRLIPLKSGQLTIPPITCTRDGESVLTREIKILVQEPSAQADDDEGDFFAEASLSNDDIVPGQQAVYTLKLCTAKRIKGASFDPPGFEGLTAKQLTDWSKYTRTINGRAFTVNEAKYLVQADAAGQFTIAPGVFVAQVPEERAGQQDPFGAMFNDSFFRDSFSRDSFFDSTPTKSVKVVSNPVDLKVSALPEYIGDQPFSGLVGQFSMSSSLDKTEVKAGESATLTVIIRGTGNIMDAPLPALNLDTAKFKVYKDAPAQDVQVTEQGFTGHKEFKQALVASVPGKTVIPGLLLVYFDTESKTYKTITTKPLTLDVRPNGPVSVVDATSVVNEDAGTAAPQIEKSKVKLQNKDILEIKEDISGIHSLPSLSLSWFAFLVCLPALGFGAASAAMRLGAREKSLKGQCREKAKDYLKKARKLPPDDPGFLPGLSSALTYAVLARGDKGGESLTRDEARQILSQNGQDQKIVDQVTQLMDTMDAARFGGKTMDKNTARDCLGQVSSLIRTLMIVVCLGSSLFIFRGTGMAAPDFWEVGDTTASNQVHHIKDKAGIFVDAVRAYKAGDYAAAAAQFESIAKNQVNNPDLFYNTGNAYLKAKDIGRAILWYERAKKLAPTDPDLKFNLAYAQSLLKDEKETSFSFTDILYFWQGLISLRGLQYASITLSFCFFIWATAQKIRGRQIFSGIGIFICLVFAGTTLAAGLEYNRINSSQKAVIVAEQADVRSGTMENATLLFDLHAGTRVRVLGKKDNYMKIRFAKDKVGWVACKDAEII